MRDIVNVDGPDRVGIIAEVCTQLAQLNINIIDISQTVMEGFFTMMMVTDTSKANSDFDTIADVLALDTDENIHTTEVYVIEDVTVTEEAAQYYHNYYLTQGEDDLRLYCNNGQSQYGWVADYIGETIDVEIAPCQWNTRTPYACCILSVTDSEGNTVYNELNFD